MILNCPVSVSAVVAKPIFQGLAETVAQAQQVEWQTEEPTQGWFLRIDHQWSLEQGQPIRCKIMCQWPKANLLPNRALIRAFGLQKTPPSYPNIIDMTAGLGEDSWLLACAGAQVQAYERNPWIFLLLQQQWQSRQTMHSKACDRLAFYGGDARLAVLPQPHQAIYLDPMFSCYGQGAVKRNMQGLRHFIQDTPAETEDLLSWAFAQPVRRLVIKRHRFDKIYHSPTWQLTGRVIRFDIYDR